MSLEDEIRDVHNRYFDALHDIALSVATIRTGRIVVDELEKRVIKFGELLRREGTRLLREAS